MMLPTLLLSFKDLELNIESRLLKKGEQLIELTKKEYDLLLMFMKNINRVLTREILLENIWGYDVEIETNVVDVYVRHLRNKLDSVDKESYIQTDERDGVCDERMKKSKDLTIQSSINIKWKLTLWAALLMLFLFFSYTIFQYFVIQNWVVNQEKRTIQKKMEEITAYIQDSNFKENVSESEHYLDVLNEKYQLIRIVKENNSPLFTISDEVPQSLGNSKKCDKRRTSGIFSQGRSVVDIIGSQSKSMVLKER